MTARGGRDGHVRVSEGILDLDLRVPEQMGGHGGATNPEPRFAAGDAACFEGTLCAVVRTGKVALTNAGVTAAITLNVTDDKRYALSVELRGNWAGHSDENTSALMQAAHQICADPSAMRGNVDVQLLLETDTVPAALAAHSDGSNI